MLMYSNLNLQETASRSRTTCTAFRNLVDLLVLDYSYRGMSAVSSWVR